MEEGGEKAMRGNQYSTGWEKQYDRGRAKSRQKEKLRHVGPSNSNGMGFVEEGQRQRNGRVQSSDRLSEDIARNK